jgi:hypothetical protein
VAPAIRVVRTLEQLDNVEGVAENGDVLFFDGEQWVPRRDATNTYTYEQNHASAEWEIEHGLGRFPSVAVVDSAGTQVIPDVTYVNQNILIVRFSAAFAGIAYLN